MRGRWPFLRFDTDIGVLNGLILLFLLPLFVAEDGDFQHPHPQHRQGLDEARWANGQNNGICPVRGVVEIQAEYLRHPMCSVTTGGQDPQGDGFLLNTTETTITTTEKGLETPASTARLESELDTESPLDNEKFLSFEEWKKKNLAKVGQSADNVRGNRPGSGSTEMRRRPYPGKISNALDSLGEEGEIELGFGGFDPDDPNIPPLGKKDARTAQTTSGDESPVTKGTEGEIQSDGVPRRGVARRKDAGTTCKERFNYASFDCAATVLKTNKECTGSSSILIENKDSYMLNECRAKDKFIILELCDDILVDTVVLANYEFFSSIFRTFRVSVSDRYPAKPDKWKELGTYEAANTREIQAFAVENPLIWTRYLKIEFLSHYGNEFYCPVSLVRVHGTTMMEEYKNYGDTARAEEETVQAVQPTQETPGAVSTVDQSNQTQKENCKRNATASVTKTGAESLPDEEALGALCFPELDEIEKLLLGYNVNNMSSIYDLVSEHEYQYDSHDLAESESVTAKATGSTASEDIPQSDTPSTTNGGDKSQKPASEARVASTSSSTEAENDTVVESQRTPIASQPPPPNPTTQESFFKSVHKRLQMLETNSTLSLLYIEEQSRILRDAFNKVEKRQLAKTSSFLENLNATVLHELRDFRQQYDHIWRSVVLEFEQQRQQYHHELFAVTTQLAILADEVVFQKRVSIIQSVFVLLCLGLVLFSRSAVGSYLEFPKVQNMVSRTHSFRSASPSYETPSASPNTVRQRPSYSKANLHRRNVSEDQTDSELCSPTFAYHSPPLSEGPSPSEEEEKGLNEVQSDYARPMSSSPVPVENLATLKRQKSSPAELGEATNNAELRPP
ncbi:conserved hypothetical protein [Uncinocarpus reesii 1704]|uniref:SUN domain-containing protein n=1 Tax=Uncinocarpus reesii (strain UAMH 1704) TaxID=336963 RepID=C4JNE0_UNCRE|nr:uncharacterized protein UREG_04346 [Uncinocarpus reesii 1704]EEP79500.1 conserved hypothetical protein [Uncinocarpus reesii 1704]